MHSLLKRQIKRFFGGEPPPATDPRVAAFIDAVDSAYREFDIDRAMLERSLDLSSQELLQSNSEMRAVFQALPDLVLRVSTDGTILAFKTGADDDLLVPPSVLSGKRVQDVPDPLVADLFREALDEVARGKPLVHVDYSLRVHGEDHFYEARLVPLIENQILVVIRNMTEHRHAEEALRQAEQQYRSIFENSLEGIFQCTPQGRFITVNPALARMLGYLSPAEMMAAVQDMFRELLADPARQEDYAGRLRDHGFVRGFECQLRRRDQGLIWASFYTRAAHDQSGQLLYYEGMVEDVSERNRLQERFLQSQKMEAFGQLAGGIAHDFNNILTVIRGNTDLLQSGIDSEEERRSTLLEIDMAAERASNLTQQLLTFSRRQPMRPQEHDLNEVVAATTRMLRRLIGEDISLETRFAAGNPIVRADSGMLTQLLFNLALNARDAMPKGGRLIVETALVDGARPRPATGEMVQVVRLSVRDTGCGIPAELRAHIFEPFFTTKEVGKGTGLGLATVFGIVEQHEGWIDVESEVDQGTTFHVYLPRRSTGRPLAEPSPEPPVRQGHETILLVEDEAAVRSLTRRQLERCGYRVHEASSGVAALDTWRQHADRVDLLITDVVMPGGLTGRELAERLLAEKPTLKVILCSGYSEGMADVTAEVPAGVAFIQKPFEKKAFLQCVRDILDTPRR